MLLADRSARGLAGTVLATVLATVLMGCGGGERSPLDRTTPPTSVPPAAATSPPRPTSVHLAPAPWTLAVPISREVLVTDGTTIYLAGGLDGAGASSGAVRAIDPASGVQRTVGALTYPVHDAMGVWRDGRIVVVAGGSPPIRTDVQAVTPGAATTVVGRVPAPPRADHVVAEVDGTIYALGGGDEAATLLGTVVASSDGGATWRAAGSLVEPVRYPAVAVVDGLIYLFGGVRTTGGLDTASVQRYDPRTQQTMVVATLPAPLSHSTAVVLDGVVFLLGGYVDNRRSAQVWRFDPATAAVSVTGATLAAPVSDSAAVVIGGVGYLVGGEGADGEPVPTVTVVRPAR